MKLKSEPKRGPKEPARSDRLAGPVPLMGASFSILNVRRFTTQATNIIKLIPSDVGRPITDLASELHYPELANDAREVLRTLSSVQKPSGARDGRWFTVRIMPCRTLDNRIDGVVITFTDITAAKTLKAKLRGQHASLARHVTETSGKRTGAMKPPPAEAIAPQRTRKHKKARRSQQR